MAYTYIKMAHWLTHTRRGSHGYKIVNTGLMVKSGMRKMVRTGTKMTYTDMALADTEIGGSCR
jgi:hypothetical protein